MNLPTFLTSYVLTGKEIEKLPVVTKVLISRAEKVNYYQINIHTTLKNSCKCATVDVVLKHVGKSEQMAGIFSILEV